ncbi:RHS repeat-associated core domain-containing protein [Halobacteriovorax sp. Y22]|nr:RHS repeat-associated core domain-containing protein [Halobacteriovorax sp. Y22]
MNYNNSRNRYYNPGAGRFMSEDPIGFAGRDINFYRYAGNNSINKNDPNGKVSVQAVCFAVIGGSGIINTAFDILELRQILEDGEMLADYYNSLADELEKEKNECTNRLRKRKLEKLIRKYRDAAIDSINDSVDEALKRGKDLLPGDLLQTASSLSCNGVGKLLKRLF